MRLRRLPGIIVCCAVAGTVWPNSAQGDDVLPGHDLFTTGDGSSHNFAETPIPADFFHLGSYPVVEVVALEGSPLGSYDGYSVGDADTIVRRLDTATLPSDGDSDTIQTEIVALSLTGLLGVHYDMTEELWYVEVTLSSTASQPRGTMTITHSNSTGGTFSSNLKVVPQFTFTHAGYPPTIRTLDGADIGYQVDMSTTNTPTWEHEPGHFQLVREGLTGPNFYIYGDTRHDGPHPKVKATKEAQIPTLPEWGLAVLTLLVLTAGTVVFGRRRRAAA